MGFTQTDDAVLRVSTEPAEGSRVTIISPNWADKTTWLWKSIQTLGVTMVDSGDQLTYNPPSGKEGPWVDNYHGKYSNEDYAVTEEGHIPRLKVYVDTGGGPVLKTEQDPHTGSGGDYTVDYSTGDITFLSALGVSDVVTADIYEVGSSEFFIKPEAGKKLKIVRVEVQFSKDISITDTVKYQLNIASSPYGDPVIYKTMQDYVNESDGAYPIIYKTTDASPTWRDLSDDVQTLPWQYAAITELKSSLDMDIKVSLEHDVPFDGSYAVATFYCLSYVE